MKEKERVYLVPVIWLMTGHYAIKATSADAAVEKAGKLPLPDDGTYINHSWEACEDEVGPITPDFTHLKVHE